MAAFRRRWVGSISDYRLASRIVVAASVALPAMYIVTEALLWLMTTPFLLGPQEPLHWSYATRPVLIFGCVVALSVWLVARKSKAASIIMLLLTGLVAAAVGLLAVSAYRLLPSLFMASMRALAAITVIELVSTTLLAAGWSATAFLSWRAVLATFAVERLRLTVQSVVGEVFD